MVSRRRRNRAGRRRGRRGQCSQSCCHCCLQEDDQQRLSLMDITERSRRDRCGARRQRRKRGKGRRATRRWSKGSGRVPSPRARRRTPTPLAPQTSKSSESSSAATPPGPRVAGPPAHTITRPPPGTPSEPSHSAAAVSIAAPRHRGRLARGSVAAESPAAATPPPPSNALPRSRGSTPLSARGPHVIPAGPPPSGICVRAPRPRRRGAAGRRDRTQPWTRRVVATPRAHPGRGARRGDER